MNSLKHSCILPNILCTWVNISNRLLIVTGDHTILFCKIMICFTVKADKTNPPKKTSLQDESCLPDKQRWVILRVTSCWISETDNFFFFVPFLFLFSFFFSFYKHSALLIPKQNLISMSLYPPRERKPLAIRSTLVVYKPPAVQCPGMRMPNVGLGMSVIDSLTSYFHLTKYLVHSCAFKACIFTEHPILKDHCVYFP